MEYLHTMVRVADLGQGARLLRGHVRPARNPPRGEREGSLHPRLLAAPGDYDTALETKAPQVELTYNWDPETYSGGRNFGHLAYQVDDIYAFCARLQTRA